MLKGRVAVVTGASRGAGRGIALALGEAGATVYVTGRSSRGHATENLPGSIDETAEAVTARGGRGIPVRCDHTVDEEVQALFGQVRHENGHLDLLVNNAWGGYAGMYDGSGWGDGTQFDAPFWQQSLSRWDGMFTAGVRAHLVATYYGAPLMLGRPHGLIINTTFYDEGKYLGNVFYDVAKAAVNRAAFALSHDFAPHGIAAIALTPGFMRTERTTSAGAIKDLSRTESPEYIGRAVVALATDPNLMAKTGQTLATGDLAQEYGFTDVDGRQLPPCRI
jgi:NAD(P)-dependent dehydrogenase (short-subunit alcohol dehydrogenase family)